MKAVGVVVEYNPFHNGHLYHLNQSRKETSAELIIAVMSGNFLQRGEPALTSKWNRTKMALESGVDVVVELPYAYATQKAETFAYGAVKILNALKCDYLCFGSELGMIEPFLHTYQQLQEKQPDLDAVVKKAMKDGFSYPKAMSLAFETIVQDKQAVDLTKPNNILGFHYVQAIQQLQSKMQPITILRTSAGYHDSSLPNGTIASATSIRNAIFAKENQQQDIQQYIPKSTANRLAEYHQRFQLLHSWENYFQLLKYTVLTMSKNELQSIYEMEEGLENRILTHIKAAQTFQQFIENLKTKRYTWTRLQRLCIHILTRTTKTQMKSVHTNRSDYIRLLGMSQKGRTYLSKIKKELSLQMISKLSSYQNPMLELDIKAAYTYAMVLAEPHRSTMIQEEFATPPIILNQ